MKAVCAADVGGSCSTGVNRLGHGQLKSEHMFEQFLTLCSTRDIVQVFDIEHVYESLALKGNRSRDHECNTDGT